MALAIARARPEARSGANALIDLTLFVGLSLMLLAVTTRVGPVSVLTGLGIVVMSATAIWMFLTSRYEIALAVLLVYLGLFDGYLKLKTGSQFATLGRDVLLYALVLGLLLRSMLRHERVAMPPLIGLVAAFVALTLVQVLNPGTGDIGRGLASLRPHLEFVPLFVLGFLVVRTKRRLMALLVLLAVVGAANGVVSLVQFNLTPEQLAAWGPGYFERINGTGGLSGRTFLDTNNQARVRPFGLASDAGGGGLVGLLTLPAALALIGLFARNKAAGIAAVPLLAGIALAIVTSQGRTIIVGAVISVFVYTIVTMLSRRLVPTLISIAAATIVLLVTTSGLSQQANNRDAFSRYDTITPDQILKTTKADRGDSISLVGQYALRYPLGAGLGTAGPAAGFGRDVGTLNGETQFNFLVLELGVVGALLFLTLMGRVVVTAVTSIRRIRDLDLRLMLAGLTTPLIALIAVFFSGTPTTGSPAGPYFWACSGVLMYWLTSCNRGGAGVVSARAVRA